MNPTLEGRPVSSPTRIREAARNIPASSPTASCQWRDEGAETPVFTPFDYHDSPSSTYALSISSTSSAPQAFHAEEHQINNYYDCLHQFQSSVPHTPIPVHVSSAQPEAGPSRTMPGQYYSYNPLLTSQLVRRSTASPRTIEMPYTKRPSVDNTEDRELHSFHPIPKQKIGSGSSKRPDPQTPLRLSSDLQATPE